MTNKIYFVHAIIKRPLQYGVGHVSRIVTEHPLLWAMKRNIWSVSHAQGKDLVENTEVVFFTEISEEVREEYEKLGREWEAARNRWYK